MPNNLRINKIGGLANVAVNDGIYFLVDRTKFKFEQTAVAGVYVCHVPERSIKITGITNVIIEGEACESYAHFLELIAIVFPDTGSAGGGSEIELENGLVLLDNVGKLGGPLTGDTEITAAAKFFKITSNNLIKLQTTAANLIAYIQSSAGAHLMSVVNSSNSRFSSVELIDNGVSFSSGGAANYCTMNLYYSGNFSLVQSDGTSGQIFSTTPSSINFGKHGAAANLNFNLVDLPSGVATDDLLVINGSQVKRISRTIVVPNPVGATKQLQYNDGGAMAGDAKLLWDKTIAGLGVNVTPLLPLHIKGAGANVAGGAGVRLENSSVNKSFDIYADNTSALQFYSSEGAANVFKLTWAGVQFPSAVSYSVVARTSALTMNDTHRFVLVTANSFTVTLPTAVGNTGKCMSIKNIGTGTTTIATVSSQTIDGAAPGTLAQWAKINLMSDGANWYTI